MYIIILTIDKTRLVRVCLYILNIKTRLMFIYLYIQARLACLRCGAGDTLCPPEEPGLTLINYKGDNISKYSRNRFFLTPVYLPYRFFLNISES